MGGCGGVWGGGTNAGGEPISNAKLIHIIRIGRTENYTFLVSLRAHFAFGGLNPAAATCALSPYKRDNIS